jgi:hypothetical protein
MSLPPTLYALVAHYLTFQRAYEISQYRPEYTFLACYPAHSIVLLNQEAYIRCKQTEHETNHQPLLAHYGNISLTQHSIILHNETQYKRIGHLRIPCDTSASVQLENISALNIRSIVRMKDYKDGHLVMYLSRERYLYSVYLNNSTQVPTLLYPEKIDVVHSTSNMDRIFLQHGSTILAAVHSHEQPCTWHPILHHIKAAQALQYFTLGSLEMLAVLTFDNTLSVYALASKVCIWSRAEVLMLVTHHSKLMYLEKDYLVLWCCGGEERYHAGTAMLFLNTYLILIHEHGHDLYLHPLQFLRHITDDSSIAILFQEQK